MLSIKFLGWFLSIAPLENPRYVTQRRRNETVLEFIANRGNPNVSR